MEFLPSVAMGKPIALRVHYMNDGSKSTRVVCKYTFAWIEELPDPSNLKAYADLENEAWNSLTNKPATGIPGTQAISEKTFVTAPPKIGLEFTEITNIVATPDIVRKLDGNSAIYFAGRATDAEDKELLIYCVRLDKNRNQIVTMCKEHN